MKTNSKRTNKRGELESFSIAKQPGWKCLIESAVLRRQRLDRSPLESRKGEMSERGSEVDLGVQNA